MSHSRKFNNGDDIISAEGNDSNPQVATGIQQSSVSSINLSDNKDPNNSQQPLLTSILKKSAQTQAKGKSSSSSEKLLRKQTSSASHLTSSSNSISSVVLQSSTPPRKSTEDNHEIESGGNMSKDSHKNKDTKGLMQEIVKRRSSKRKSTFDPYDARNILKAMGVDNHYSAKKKDSSSSSSKSSASLIKAPSTSNLSTNSNSSQNLHRDSKRKKSVSLSLPVAVLLEDEKHSSTNIYSSANYQSKNSAGSRKMANSDPMMTKLSIPQTISEHEIAEGEAITKLNENNFNDFNSTQNAQFTNPPLFTSPVFSPPAADERVAIPTFTGKNSKKAECSRQSEKLSDLKTMNIRPEDTQEENQIVL